MEPLNNDESKNMSLERFRFNWLESIKKELTRTSRIQHELRELVLRKNDELIDTKWMFSLKDKVPKVQLPVWGMSVISVLQSPVY